jgi:hypothetical protein
MNGINGLREERMIFKQLFPVAYILEKQVVCNQTDFSGSGEISAGSWVCGNPAVDEA